MPERLANLNMKITGDLLEDQTWSMNMISWVAELTSPTYLILWLESVGHIVSNLQTIADRRQYSMCWYLLLSMMKLDIKDSMKPLG